MLRHVVFAVLIFSTQIFVLLLIEWATFEATVKFKPVTTHFILFYFISISIFLCHVKTINSLQLGYKL